MFRDFGNVLKLKRIFFDDTEYAEVCESTDLSLFTFTDVKFSIYCLHI